jgi:hypothetical protein
VLLCSISAFSCSAQGLSLWQPGASYDTANVSRANFCVVCMNCIA